MELVGTLIAVKDMEASKKFYTELLGMEITMDFGANVTLNNHLSLQTLETWPEYTEAPPAGVRFGGGEMELVFEVEELDPFLEKLKAWPGITRRETPKTFPWGQGVVYLHDPDGHFVEVGESMKTVTKRALLEGLSDEETQKRVMYPLPFVQMCRDELKKAGKL